MRIGRNRRLAPGSVSEPRPGGAIVAPRPSSRRRDRPRRAVLGRIAGLDRDRAILRQQQHDAHLQHQRGLIGGGPQHVVERAGAGELAAEGIELTRSCATRPIAAIGLRAHARGDIGHHDRDQHEEEEGRDIGRIGDREGVDRRQEEEVVAQRRRDAGQQRRPQAVAHRDADDRGQEHQVDVLDAEPRLDQPPTAEAERDDRRAPSDRDADRTARPVPPSAPPSSAPARPRARRRQ